MMLNDDGPLPRRKSRAPFGERLSLVSDLKSHPPGGAMSQLICFWPYNPKEFPFCGSFWLLQHFLLQVQYNNPEPIPPDQQSEVSEADPVEELKRIANCSLPPIEPEKQLRCIMDCILPPR